MLKPRLITFFIFAALALIASFWLFQKTPSLHQTSKQNPATHQFNEAILHHYDNTSALKYTLKTPDMTEFQNGQRKIKNATLITYDKNTQPLWQLNSPLMTTNDMRLFVFQKGLVATRLIDNATIILKRAQYNAQTEVLQSKENATITGQNWKSTSQGLMLNLKKDELTQPKRVTDIYEK